MLSYYLLITLITVGNALIMMTAVQGNTLLSRKRKQLFILLFSCIAVAALCEWGGTRLEGQGQTARILIPLLKVIEFSLAPAQALLYAAALDPEDHLVKTASGIALAHAVIECVVAPFGLVFYVDAAGMYHHGALYSLYITAYVLSAAFLALAVKLFSNSYQYRNRHVPWLVLAYIFLSLGVQMTFENKPVIWLACGIGATILYNFYCSVIQQTDALTRLLNRSSFEATATRLDSPAKILFFDIDDFKQINDVYGHVAGDTCLRLVGKHIYQTFSTHGLCFRVGGDEFFVLVTDMHANTDELEKAFATSLAAEQKGDLIMPCVSIGEALFDPSADDLMSIYGEADELMYGQKRKRKAAKADSPAK